MTLDAKGDGRINHHVNFLDMDWKGKLYILLEYYVYFSFDLRRSGLSLSGYPITYSESDGLMFYVRFLDSVNLHGNPYAAGMSQTDFLERNFCVVEDLTKYDNTDGSLTVRLKFEDILTDNLLLLCLPLTKRELVFTDNLAVHIQ